MRNQLIYNNICDQLLQKDLKLKKKKKTIFKKVHLLKINLYIKSTSNLGFPRMNVSIMQINNERTSDFNM